MRKWKVLIADDEFIIRDGIHSSVDWERYNMEVVGEAEDGEEAVEVALEHQVDILLIDLNMPIMNGLEAMKQIKQQLPACKMVVVSGYDEFRYAQEALRLKVEDYLLKPVNPGKLEAIIMELQRKLDMEVSQKEFVKQATIQIKRNQTQLKERFFQDWMEGQLANEEIMEQLQFLNLPVTTPIQYIVIKWPDYHLNQMFMQENDRQIYLFAIENIVKEMIKSNKIIVFWDRSHLLNICLWEPINQEQMTEIRDVVQHYFSITIYYHMEDIKELEFTHLYKVYDRCKREVDKQIKISPIVKDALSYIRQHYQDSSLTLEKVAEELHITTVYLSRIMKHELGISYVGLLTQMRINKAVDLLKTTELSIRDIAEAVGYDSQHYFSTTFKKIVGVSPMQFKN
ncbi:response regulator transcription factor [Bacillus sp. REN16]|uniref:response regulator transcription factor n=1 Tax=Bacillus sp. REN16 TaxID=2887296 RepID=UPI001E4B9F5B|nr:response regulator [Bacillus sp. REN16]MCC3356790.1 response regulator [Bacillus sp. REN16]